MGATSSALFCFQIRFVQCSVTFQLHAHKHTLAPASSATFTSRRCCTQRSCACICRHHACSMSSSLLVCVGVCLGGCCWHHPGFLSPVPCPIHRVGFDKEPAQRRKGKGHPAAGPKQCAKPCPLDDVEQTRMNDSEEVSYVNDEHPPQRKGRLLSIANASTTHAANCGSIQLPMLIGSPHLQDVGTLVLGER